MGFPVELITCISKHDWQTNKVYIAQSISTTSCWLFPHFHLLIMDKYNIIFTF